MKTLLFPLDGRNSTLFLPWLIRLLNAGLSISTYSVECMSSKPLISNFDNIFKHDVIYLFI